MLFLLAVVCFAVFWLTTAFYVREAYRLVERVEADHPDFWRDGLGAPRFVAHHRQQGLTLQINFYLQPLLPFLRWVLAGSAEGRSEATRHHHRRTRRLFLGSLVGFLVTARLFLLVINALMVQLVAWFLPSFTVAGFWSAMGAAIIVSLTSWVASWYVGPRGGVEVMVVRR